MRAHLSSVFVLSFLAAVSALACGGADTPAATDDEAELQARSARFEIFDGADGKVHFDLVGGRGERALHSPAFATRADALAGVEQVVLHATNANAYFLDQEMNGDWHANVFENGHVIAMTGASRTERDAQKSAKLARALLRVVELPKELTPTKQRARFEVLHDASGYSFRLLDDQGAPLLGSRVYPRKDDALTAIDNTRLYGDGGDPTRYEIQQAAAGFTFRIVAYNGVVEATSVTFQSRAEAERGVAASKKLLDGGVAVVE
jgi:uncharacterized protein YegP (UPF0339 family)